MMKLALPLALLLHWMAGAPPAATPPPASAGEVYSSNLMVDQDVSVSCQITGVIDKIYVDRGSAVTKGQGLAALNMREFDANVQQAKEDMELKRAQLDRAKALSAGNVLSKADLDEKRALYAVAVASWEKAKATREYAVIRAPFAGIVTEKYIRLGQKVVEVQTQPLFKITATEPLLARVYLPEQDLLSVRRGDKVEVVPDKFPKSRTTGTVQFISPTVDPASGTFQVIIQVRRDASQPILRPGLAVKVHFNNSRRS
jgi:RND family efflux transporter MFP subunit